MENKRRLLNRSKNNSPLVSELEIAETFVSRLVGLLGKNELPANAGLWIKQCKSIHTFFMQFAIDVIFLDKEMTVRKIYHNVQPWRLTPYVFSADSVVELPAGALQNKSIEVGDMLYVGN